MASRGSTLERNFDRLYQTYPAAPGTTEPFTANGVYDKLTVLVLLMVVSGAVGAVALPTALVFPCVLLAFGAAIGGMFKPLWAKTLAPAYAILEGLALGVISKAYSSFGGGIVPLAVLGTAGVFVGCLAAYRSGLVKVTPKFMMVTMIASLALVVVFVASILGLPIPGVNDIGTRGLLFGAIGLVVGVLNLFVDFAYVQSAERRGADARGEWYGALALLSSLVLVYLSILRMLASASRR